MEFKTKCGAKGVVETFALDGKKQVGHSKISLTNGVLDITAWYVDNKYKGKGIGKQLLLVNLQAFNKAEIEEIQYSWNGANYYVFEWLEKNFNPISKCPISVQKISSEWLWDSNIYKLDKERFFKYFGI